MSGGKTLEEWNQFKRKNPKLSVLIGSILGIIIGGIIVYALDHEAK